MYAELFRSTASNKVILLPCTWSRKWFEGGVWSSKCNSVSKGVLPRGRTPKLIVRAPGYLQAFESEGRREGRGLEFGSLFRVATPGILMHTIETGGWMEGKRLTQIPAVQFVHCLNGQKAVSPGSEHTCLSIQM